MSLSAGARLGPYEILAPIGAGGMGIVYRARDTRLDREVAIKVLPGLVATDPERLRRFEQETRAVGALNHPHILTVYDVGTQDGAPYVVTELLEGETLREVLLRRAPATRQVVAWGMQAAQALSAAHGKGIVHRDVKPENLFLTSDGRIKILDFGLAKLTRVEEQSSQTQDSTAAGSTQPGVVLGTVAYMSPEQVRAEGMDHRSDIFSLGVVLYELLCGENPFRRGSVTATLTAILHETPVELSTRQASIPPAVERIVERSLEKRREDRFQSAHDLALALEAVLEGGSAAAALREIVERSPYPGLSSFTEADATHFFGREQEVKELWERLRERRLLAVIGPSGAGKTSFVRAGVAAGRPEGWAAIVATPGNAPLRGLGRALGPQLARDPEALRELASFEDGETAVELLSRWRHNYDDALVVVDQFEELFTLNPAETQGRFASLLGRLASEADVHVLLSLRDDFLMRCHDHPALGPVFGELTPLGAMTREGLRRALIEPALKHGYRFEDDALVEEMVGAVEGARAALPLLAFAVSRLWERRDREKKLLTRDAYKEIGGVAGALAQHAEATYERIGSEREAIVREIFRNLTTAQGTRAVLDREELLSPLPDRAAGEGVLRQLLDARLLTSYETEGGEGEPSRHRVEIVHESLLKAWPRLVRWQTQDADGAQLRDQLRQAAHLWEERGKTEDLLWTGASFLDFRAWRERYSGGLSAVEEDFARSMASVANRRRRQRRVAAAAILVVLTVGLGIFGALWRRSTAQARRAEASKLLAIAQLRLQEDPTEALAFTTASLELADTSEARLTGLRALQEAPPAWEVPSGFSYAAKPRFSQDGRHLSVGGPTSIVGLWSENGGPPILLRDLDVTSQDSNVGAWVSDKLLVTGLIGGTGWRAQLWSMPAGTKLRTIDFGAPSRWQIGHGRLFAMTEVASSPGVLDLRSWRLPEGDLESLGRVDTAKLGMTSSAFEPHGRGWFYTVGTTTRFLPLPAGRGGDRVFSRHAANVEICNFSTRRGYGFYGRPELIGQHAEDGENRLLSFPESGSPVTTTLPKPASAPPNVHPTTSDRWVAGNPGEDARLRLWERTALPGARPLELRREGSWYFADADLADAGRLAVATTHNLTRLTFWRLPGVLGSVVDGYKGVWRPLAFSPDGKWLATSWEDRRLRLWPLPGSGSSEVKVLNTPAVFAWTSLVFDPRGKYLFAVGFLDNAWIVPLDGSPGRRLDHFSDDTVLYGAAVSPSGQRVATAFGYGKGPKTLRVWDVETGSVSLFDLPLPPAPAPGGDAGGVRSLAFLDESTVLTTGDGGIRRWHLDTGTYELVRPMAFGRVGSMRLSSDRREVLFCEGDRMEQRIAVSCGVIELATGVTRPFAGALIDRHAGDGPYMRSLATQGPAVAMLGHDGSVRVGLRSGGEPHFLLGHAGVPDKAEISPDLRWVASTGEDNTLRLWPMPDLSKPPLQTLPHDELVAKLKSLTNLRAVRDAASETGWKIDLAPFPGWAKIPE